MSRRIKVQIQSDGTLKVDNAGNPDEKRILAELAELAELLNGQANGFKVEAHVHTHATAHTHSDGTVHVH